MTRFVRGHPITTAWVLLGVLTTVVLFFSGGGGL